MGDGKGKRPFGGAPEGTVVPPESDERTEVETDRAAADQSIVDVDGVLEVWHADPLLQNVAVDLEDPGRGLPVVPELLQIEVALPSDFSVDELGAAQPRFSRSGFDLFIEPRQHHRPASRRREVRNEEAVIPARRNSEQCAGGVSPQPIGRQPLARDQKGGVVARPPGEDRDRSFYFYLFRIHSFSSAPLFRPRSPTRGGGRSLPPPSMFHPDKDGAVPFRRSLDLRSTRPAATIGLSRARAAARARAHIPGRFPD